MNSTGCPPHFANDGFFSAGTDSVVAPCTFPIPFYIVFMAIAVLLQLVLASTRTSLIFSRVRFAKKLSKRGHFSWIQITTLLVTWFSVLVNLAILIVPLTYGDDNHIMVFLIGLQVFLFQNGAIKWADKLVRLGSRIIDPKSKGSGTPENESEDPLRKRDNVLKVLAILVRVIALFQLICWCVLSMIFLDDILWFLVGCGCLSLFVVISVCVNVYQYQRCKNAIYDMQKRVEGNIIGKGTSTVVAINKFTKHQIIQLSGLPCALVFLLWAVEVIPASFAHILFCVGCDAFVNVSMLVTFIGSKRRKRGPALEENKIVAVSGGGEAYLSTKNVTQNESSKIEV